MQWQPIETGRFDYWAQRTSHGPRILVADAANVTVAMPVARPGLTYTPGRTFTADDVRFIDLLSGPERIEAKPDVLFAPTHWTDFPDPPRY